MYQRVWGLDISNQASLPEVKFSSAMIDFPFIFAGKSNGILEVWDVTRNEIVNTVIQTELANTENLANRMDYEGWKGIFTIRLNEIGKVCIANGSHDIFVIDATLLKSETDSSLLGYRMLRYDESWNMEVDSTCIVVSQGDLGEVKFDFWPIFPANFKLNQVEPEDGGKKSPVKIKKRADNLCSAGHSQDTKTRDGDELEDTKREGDFMKNV